jgi:hypothetical protein
MLTAGAKRLRILGAFAAVLRQAAGGHGDALSDVWDPGLTFYEMGDLTPFCRLFPDR